MHKLLSIFLVAALAFVSLAQTGCTQAKFDSTVATISSEIPAAVALASDIAVLAGSNKDFAKISGLLGADLPAIKAAVDTYLANKTSGTKAAVFAAVDSLQSNFNTEFLALNTVTNQKSQQALLTKLAAVGAVISGFELALAPFFNKQAQARTNFQTIQPYIPREQQERVAETYGYTLGQLGL